MSILSLAANVVVITSIFQRWIKTKKNPYCHEIFDDSDDYKEAYQRIDFEFEGLKSEFAEPLLVSS